MATPEEMAQSMINNLPEKTGKALPEWISIVKNSSFEKHGQIVKMLKTDHGMTHGYASLVSQKFRETDEEIDLVATQYAGTKANLKPIYDALITYIETLGADVDIAPKKSSVSLRRKKQFALITPATKTRIDLGLALKGEQATTRLETYNAMCSHRIRIESADDIDDTVKGWLETAYDRAG